MKARAVPPLLFALVVVVASGAEAVPALPAVPVTGALVAPGFAFDATARATAARASVAVANADTSSTTYAGVALADVVHAAGASVGADVRGAAARAFVIVHAADGYAAVFSLAETRTSDAACAPLLVDARDGQPLDASVGPLRVVVAPCDLTHARWVHGVTSLEIVVAPGAAGVHAAR